MSQLMLGVAMLRSRVHCRKLKEQERQGQLIRERLEETKRAGASDMVQDNTFEAKASDGLVSRVRIRVSVKVKVRF